MKKLSYLVLSFLLVLTCGIFSACNTTESGSIKLSTNHVSIYLGETENNTAIVNAVLENVDMSKFTIVYDPSQITVTRSEDRLWMEKDVLGWGSSTHQVLDGGQRRHLRGGQVSL